MVISVRSLQKLFRRDHISLEDMAACVQTATAANGQMHTDGSLHGIQRRYVVSQNTIRQVIKLFNSEGVTLRQAQRLRRRCYCNKGEVLWDMDS